MLLKPMILHLMLMSLGILVSWNAGGPSMLANGRQIWSTNQATLPEEATLYSSRLPLKVHYLGGESSFRKWIAPAHCSAANPKDTKTDISCSMAGLYRVKLKYRQDGKTVDDSKLLIMKETPLCYRWYVLVEKGIEGSDIIAVKIWIWDPLLSSTAEMEHTAMQPSTFSAGLTKIFAGKGQVPYLAELLPDPRFQLDSSNMTFVPTQSLWQFYMQVSPCRAHRVQVSGKPSVASHGCFIMNTKAMISSLCVNEIRQSNGSSTLRGVTGVSMVVKDPCNQDTAFLIMSGQCLLTLDGFKTADHIMVPDDIILDASVNVRDIAITSDIIMYLLEEGSVLTQDRSSGSFMWLTGVSNLTAIQGRPFCHHSYLRRFENEMFIGWSDGIIHVWHGITLIESIEVTKEQIASLSYPFWFHDDDHIEVSIDYVAFTNEPNELSVLLKLTSEAQSVTVFFKKDWTSTFWGTPIPFFSKKRGESSTSLVQLYDSEGSTILWDEHNVYYSYAKGKVFDEKYGVMPIHNALADEEEIESSIKQLSVTMDGFIIVLSSTNVLYTSRHYQEALTVHSALASPDTDTAIYTNFVNQIYLIQLEGSSLVKRTSYSLKADMGSTLNLLRYTECMYYQFKEGPRYDVYYLDLRDSASIWSQLVYSADRYNDIEIEINRPNKLKLEEQVMTDFNPGSKLTKKSLHIQTNFIFDGSRPYAEALDLATGLVTIEMRPRRLGINCHAPSKMITELELSCPPQRHIRIHKPAECDDLGSFTINKKSFVHRNGALPAFKKIVQYDKEMYGCPITQTTYDEFKPEIDLYDEDVLVETMTADFVMWEENGRIDFDYTTSMLEAGCLRVAQTWEKMKEDAQHDTPVKLIWGPHNYQKCFDFEVTEKELLHESYQVLNHTGENTIRWLASGNNQLYLFTIHVIDPFYSFCSFEAKVAVITTDVAPVKVRQTPHLKISLGSFTAVTGCILFVTYLFYRRAHILDLARDLHDNYGVTDENTKQKKETEQKKTIEQKENPKL